MNNITTISFDLWNTLIDSNPEYKRKRNESFSKIFSLSVDEVNKIFEDVKHDADESVEKFGIQFSSYSIYTKLHNKLAKNGTIVSFHQVQHECEKLFLENLPIPKKDTVEILSKLKEEKYDIFLSSNTLFISGKILRLALKKLNLDIYFYECIFSDEINISKPNPLFFKFLHERSYALKKEIIHVGDNITTDVVGAENYGMNSYHITTLYNTTLTSFYQSLNK